MREENLQTQHIKKLSTKKNWGLDWEKNLKFVFIQNEPCSFLFMGTTF